ncbi:MAG: hypothetical protein ACI9G1_004371, partial [Pirellulaceae bacterium]
FDDRASRLAAERMVDRVGIVDRQLRQFIGQREHHMKVTADSHFRQSGPSRQSDID